MNDRLKLNRALDDAINRGELSEVRELLERGADPNLRNNEGRRALEMAQPVEHEGHSEVVAPLLKITQMRVEPSG